MVALQSEWKGKARKLVSEEASTGWQVFSSLSLSPSPSLSLHSLSSLSLSLPQVADLNSVRVAPLKSSCCSALELTTGCGASCCSTLHRYRPRRCQHRALRDDSLLTWCGGVRPQSKPVLQRDCQCQVLSTIGVPAGQSRCSALQCNGPFSTTVMEDSPSQPERNGSQVRRLRRNSPVAVIPSHPPTVCPVCCSLGAVPCW